MLSSLLLERGRPHLREDGYELTSPRSPLYNCIAWAADDDQRWWEPPDPDAGPSAGPSYWPPEVPTDDALDSYILLFTWLGYDECEAANLEPGFEKVAIYAADDEFTHVAKQLPSGRWTSKLGSLEDIEHNTPRGVEGPSYGTVARILKRPLT